MVSSLVADTSWIGSFCGKYVHFGHLAICFKVIQTSCSIGIDNRSCLFPYVFPSSASEIILMLAIVYSQWINFSSLRLVWLNCMDKTRVTFFLVGLY